jgi:hypothetical protein
MYFWCGEFVKCYQNLELPFAIGQRQHVQWECRPVKRYPDKILRQINDEKIKNILADEPQVATSGCPGCNLHIMDGLDKADNEAVVAHYIELM